MARLSLDVMNSELFMIIRSRVSIPGREKLFLIVAKEKIYIIRRNHFLKRFKIFSKILSLIILKIEMNEEMLIVIFRSRKLRPFKSRLVPPFTYPTNIDFIFSQTIIIFSTDDIKPVNSLFNLSALNFA